MPFPSDKARKKYFAEQNAEKCNLCHNNPKEKHSDQCIKCNKRQEDFDNQSYDNMMKKSGAINIDHLIKIAERVEKQRKDQDKNDIMNERKKEDMMKITPNEYREKFFAELREKNKKKKLNEIDKQDIMNDAKRDGLPKGYKDDDGI